MYTVFAYTKIHIHIYIYVYIYTCGERERERHRERERERERLASIVNNIMFRYMTLELYWEYGAMILAIIEAFTVRQPSRCL